MLTPRIYFGTILSRRIAAECWPAVLHGALTQQACHSAAYCATGAPAALQRLPLRL